MADSDERHGTTRGYSYGCRCDPCRSARNDYECKRRKRREVLGISYSIDATGTRRRIRALMALGWHGRAIAARCGWTSGEAVHVLCRRTWVQQPTAATIARVYDELCMTLGPSASTRRRAAAKGWPPPLAWDDIDTDPEPTGWEYHSTDRSEALRELADMGHGITEAARRLHLSRDAVQKWCERKGMSDVYRRLAAREALRGNQWTRETVA